MKFSHPSHMALVAKELSGVSSIAQLRPKSGEGASPCPFCRRAVSDDADVCGHCHHSIGDVEEESQSRGMWLLAIVGLVGAMAFSFNVFR